MVACDKPTRRSGNPPSDYTVPAWVVLASWGWFENPYYCFSFNYQRFWGGDSHMKGAWMLVVSLRGVNFRFWSRLGCCIIFSRKGLLGWRNIKKLYMFNSFYLLDSCYQSLKLSLLGVKKGWATPRLVSFRGLIQNFRRASPPLSYGSPHRAKDVWKRFWWESSGWQGECQGWVVVSGFGRHRRFPPHAYEWSTF